jgi:hypothetical protein
MALKVALAFLIFLIFGVGGYLEKNHPSLGLAPLLGAWLRGLFFGALFYGFIS